MLSDLAKRREYDSTDDFDDSLPMDCAAADFFKVGGGEGVCLEGGKGAKGSREGAGGGGHAWTVPLRTLPSWGGEYAGERETQKG